MAERARQLAQDRVAHDHRGELAAGQHVAPDRDRVAREVLDDPLVEALVAAAQQRHRGLGGQLVDERVVEHPPARGERDDAALACAGRPGRRRRSRAARASMTSTRSTIPAPPPNGVSSTWPPLSGVCSRGLSVRSSWPPASALRDVALVAEPVEPLGEQRDDVDLHPSAASGPVTRPARSRARCRRGRRGRRRSAARRRRRADRVADQRHEQRRRRPAARPRAPRTTAAAAAARPGRRARRRRRRGSPRGPRPTTRPRSSGGATDARHEQLGAAQRLDRLARVDAVEAHDRPLVGAGAADDLGVAARRCARSCRARAAPARGETRGRCRRARGAARPRRRRASPRAAGHVSRRCRRARGGSP